VSGASTLIESESNSSLLVAMNLGTMLSKQHFSKDGSEHGSIVMAFNKLELAGTTGLTPCNYKKSYSRSGRKLLNGCPKTARQFGS
jgi:hypothetical protein